MEDRDKRISPLSYDLIGRNGADAWRTYFMGAAGCKWYLYISLA